MKTLVQGSAPADPEAFGSVPELRRELHRANQQLTDCMSALAQRDKLGNELAGFVNQLLRQHLRSDHRGVAAILQARLDVSPRLRERLEEANEVEEARTGIQPGGNADALGGLLVEMKALADDMNAFANPSNMKRKA